MFLVQDVLLSVCFEHYVNDGDRQDTESCCVAESGFETQLALLHDHLEEDEADGHLLEHLGHSDYEEENEVPEEQVEDECEQALYKGKPEQHSVSQVEREVLPLLVHSRKRCAQEHNQDQAACPTDVLDQAEFETLAGVELLEEASGVTGAELHDVLLEAQASFEPSA